MPVPPDNSPRMHRLALIQAGNILVLGLIISLLLSGAYFTALLRSQQRTGQEQLARLLSAVAPFVSAGVYEINRRQVEIGVQGLIDHPFVRLVEVTDDFGTVLVDWQRPARDDFPAGFLDFAAPGKEQLSMPLRAGDHGVGSLRIILDRQALAAHVLEQSALFLAANLTAFVLLALVLSLWSHYRLSRPLLKITRRLAAFSPEQFSPRELPPLTGHVQDELGVLVREINTLIRRVQSSLNERRKIENALGQSERLYRRIFQGLQDIYFQATTDGTILLISPSAARQSGYAPEELMGRPLETLFVRPEECRRLLEKLRTQTEIQAMETVMATRDGTQRNVQINVSVVHDDFNGRETIDGIIRDITQQKTAEKQQRGLEAQLRQAQRLEVVGTLAGGVAHDFNNLLQGISVNLELALTRGQLVPKDKASLMEALRIIGRAGDLVSRLMAFSRKSDPKFSPVRLSALIRETSSLVQRTMPAHISLHLNLDENAGTVLADPGQIEQVVLNLANNARDALDDKPGTVTIATSAEHVDTESASQEIPPGNYALLTISDSGPGISEAIRDKIFDPFFTTKEVGKGTGLGLAMVYGIVQSHSGHIQCRSTPGKGTTFSIYFPTLPGDYAVPQTSRSMFSSPALSGTQKDTVLIVDDEQMIRETTAEALKEAGYFVLTAQCGEKALEIMENKDQDISLALLDLGMPGMGGQTCLEKIQALRPEILVLVASAYTDHPIARDPKAHGASGFIAKPYRLDLLFQTIARLLDSGRS